MEDGEEMGIIMGGVNKEAEKDRSLGVKDVEQIEKEIGLAMEGLVIVEGLETKGKAHVKRNQDWLDEEEVFENEKGK